MRILFLVRALGVGGAERQLVALARELHRTGHEIGVAVFYHGGAFEDELRSSGVAVHDLRKRGRWDLPGALFRLRRLVRRTRPDVLHAYLPEANILAAVARPLCPPLKVVWGIRTSMHDFTAYGWVSRAAHWVEARLSHMADLVIANSQAGAARAAERGIDPRVIACVPNGIDCSRFRRDQEGRSRVRAEWRVPEGVPLVGLVARLDPVKDHSRFLQAAARVAARRPDVRYVCVGEGLDVFARPLREQAARLGLYGLLTWAGPREDMPAVYSALDLNVLPSWSGEGFPNVVAEAMACGTPCVVTDVGDSALIVGDTGVVVPPRDPEALAAGILRALEAPAGPHGSPSTREIIERRYSLAALVDRTTAELGRLLRSS